MCGIILVSNKSGIYSTNTIWIARLLGEALHHRGKECWGISCNSQPPLPTHRGMGLVSESFDHHFMDHNPSSAVLLQVRYSTTGEGQGKKEREDSQSQVSCSVCGSQNVQPINAESKKVGALSFIHNGNIAAIKKPLGMLQRNDIKLNSQSDSEVFLKIVIHYLDNQPYGECDILKAITQAMKLCKGTYSGIILNAQYGVFAFRDVYGNRPMKIAQTKDNWIISSESVSWRRLNAKYVDSVHPGEIVHIHGKTFKTYKWEGWKPRYQQKCSFEMTYLMKSSTNLTSRITKSAGHATVADFRVKSGGDLFDLHPLPPGIVCPIEESGTYFASGYHGKCIEAGMHMHTHNPFPKDPLQGRYFIEPTDEAREEVLDKKFFNLFDSMVWKIRDVLKHNNEAWLIFLDDSLVRSHTSKKLLKLVKKTASECLTKKEQESIRTAWLLGSPPYMNPCFYGVDTPDLNELIAHKYRDLSQKELEVKVAEIIGADYVGYTSIKRFQKRRGPKWKHYCYACFNGQYKIPYDKGRSKESLNCC